MGDAECFINTSYFWHDTEVQIKITGDFYSKLKSICDGSDPRQKPSFLKKRLLTQKRPSTIFQVIAWLKAFFCYFLPDNLEVIICRRLNDWMFF